MASNNIQFITNDVNYLQHLDSKKQFSQVYFIYPQQDINVNVTIEANHDCYVQVKVIVLNHDDVSINAQFDINLMSHNNNASCEILVYGLDKSKAKVISNVKVAKDSQNNKSIQVINGLILSKQSKIIGEPNLKIDALNVDAKHKLTIGTLDKEEIFYLLSKGICLQEARKILLDAQLMHLLSGLNEQDKETCLNLVKERII